MLDDDLVRNSAIPLEVRVKVLAVCHRVCVWRLLHVSANGVQMGMRLACVPDAAQTPVTRAGK